MRVGLLRTLCKLVVLLLLLLLKVVLWLLLICLTILVGRRVCISTARRQLGLRTRAIHPTHRQLLCARLELHTRPLLRQHGHGVAGVLQMLACLLLVCWLLVERILLLLLRKLVVSVAHALMCRQGVVVTEGGAKDGVNGIGHRRRGFGHAWLVDRLCMLLL